MGDIHYARDIRAKLRINIPPTHKPNETLERMVEMDAETFRRLGDYTRSRPTGPSPGRIYKKNYGWPADKPDDWWVYICVRDPEDPEGVYHVPYLPVLT